MLTACSHKLGLGCGRRSRSHRHLRVWLDRLVALDSLDVMIQYAVSVIASGVGYYYTKKFVDRHLDV